MSRSSFGTISTRLTAKRYRCLALRPRTVRIRFIQRVGGPCVQLWLYLLAAVIASSSGLRKGIRLTLIRFIRSSCLHPLTQKVKSSQVKSSTIKKWTRLGWRRRDEEFGMETVIPQPNARVKKYISKTFLSSPSKLEYTSSKSYDKCTSSNGITNDRRPPGKVIIGRASCTQ